MNLYIAPSTEEYSLDIIDKTIDEIILTFKDASLQNLIDKMREFPLTRYSRKLQGNEIYLWET
tara:strand:+ start:177 stop:365 length:189 start_codon:yes stop_codon:yes gene_type:complete